MRDPDRIPIILQQIEKEWKKIQIFDLAKSYQVF